MSKSQKRPDLPNELPAPESEPNLPVQAPNSQNELPQSNGSRAASGSRSGQKATHSPRPHRGRGAGGEGAKDPSLSAQVEDSPVERERLGEGSQRGPKPGRQARRPHRKGWTWLDHGP